MEVKITSTCLQWPHPIFPRSSSSLKPPFSLSSSYLTTRTQNHRPLAHKFVHGSSPSGSSKLKYHNLTQSCCARLYDFSDEEFSKQIEEELYPKKLLPFSSSNLDFRVPDWSKSEKIIEAITIEMKANRVEIPLSLRIIKRKRQKWEEGFKEAKDYTYCSIDKAFSSMVFMIREIQSYNLQSREILYSEDLEEILIRVQREMHSSFVWLFQQVFSKTPTLMVYIMILLADFTVHSMADDNKAVIGSTTPSPSTISCTERENQGQPKFDSSSNRGNIKSTSLSIQFPTDVCSIGNDELITGEEVNLWSLMVEEALRMLHGELRDDEVLDHEIMQGFVAPVSVEIEADDDYNLEYFKTEMVYQMGLAQDPSSSLLLCNYAQFLCLVTHEYDRAEECFKRAVEVEPADAEALCHYANFLWKVRKDMWAAEERYLQAISAEPNNPYYTSNYANFLWITGGEDTCFPLNTSS